MKINKDTKIDLYKRMIRQRTFEDNTTKIFAGGEMPGFLHLSQGEDAVAAGTCAHLAKEDAIFTTHRGHGLTRRQLKKFWSPSGIWPKKA